MAVGVDQDARPAAVAHLVPVQPGGSAYNHHGSLADARELAVFHAPGSVHEHQAPAGDAEAAAHDLRGAARGPHARAPAACSRELATDDGRLGSVGAREVHLHSGASDAVLAPIDQDDADVADHGSAGASAFEAQHGHAARLQGCLPSPFALQQYWPLHQQGAGQLVCAAADQDPVQRLVLRDCVQRRLDVGEVLRRRHDRVQRRRVRVRGRAADRHAPLVVGLCPASEDLPELGKGARRALLWRQEQHHALRAGHVADLVGGRVVQAAAPARAGATGLYTLYIYIHIYIYIYIYIHIYIYIYISN